MKIIAGDWRGRRLKAPAGMGTRPTSARAREALFSMLASRVGSFSGLAVLDLFAGTGALGLEALSRGAASALFIERDSAAIRLLKQNIAELDAPGDVMMRDATRLGTAHQSFDIAFLDAPYDNGLTEPCLSALAAGGWMKGDAFVVVETSQSEMVSVGAFAPVSEKTYGKAKVTLLKPVC